MIFSKYNIIVRDSLGNYIFYNSLWNKAIRLTQNNYNKINFYDLCLTNHDVLSFLYKNKFVIDESEEKNALKEKYLLLTMKNSLNLTIIGTFACPYCYEDHSLSLKLKCSDYNKLIDYIRDKNISNIQINLFGGEPLLIIDDLLSFINKLKSLNINVHGGITTNGYLLTDSVFKNLIASNITTYQITIDGNREIHDRQRCLINKSPTYDIILKNLKGIHNSSIKCNVIIRCNLYADTNINSFLNDFYLNFRDDNRFSLLLYPVADWGGDLHDQVKTSKIEIIKKYTKLLRDYHIRNAYFNLLLKENTFCDYYLRNSIVILPSMKVGKCTIDFSNFIPFYDYVSKGNDYFNNLHFCNKTDCAIYPKCFGRICPLAVKENVCKDRIEEIKVFLKEYFA